MNGNRFFSGEHFGGGRIALLSHGGAIAYPSPWVDVAPLRKGNRKTPISDQVLLVIHALSLSRHADAEALREMDPIIEPKEGEWHFRSAKRAIRAAAEARRSAVLLLNGPVEAAFSTQGLTKFLLSTLAEKFGPAEQRGLEIAITASQEADRSDGLKRMLSAIERLTETSGRPPFRSEVKEELGIAISEDDRDFRRLLSKCGFDWLPINVKSVGRPRKIRE